MSIFKSLDKVDKAFVFLCNAFFKYINLLFDTVELSEFCFQSIGSDFISLLQLRQFLSCPPDGPVAPENLRRIGTVDQTHSLQIHSEWKSSRRRAAHSLTPFPSLTAS